MPLWMFDRGAVQVFCTLQVRPFALPFGCLRLVESFEREGRSSPMTYANSTLASSRALVLPSMLPFGARGPLGKVVGWLWARTAMQNGRLEYGAKKHCPPISNDLGMHAWEGNVYICLFRTMVASSVPLVGSWC